MTMVEMPDKVIQGEVVEATDKVQAPRLLMQNQSIPSYKWLR